MKKWILALFMTSPAFSDTIEIPVEGTTTVINERFADAVDKTIFAPAFFLGPTFSWSYACHIGMPDGPCNSFHHGDNRFVGRGAQNPGLNLGDGFGEVYRDTPLLPLTGRDHTKKYRLFIVQHFSLKTGNIPPKSGTIPKSNVNMLVRCGGFQYDPIVWEATQTGATFDNNVLTFSRMIDTWDCPGDALLVEFKASSFQEFTVGDLEITMLEEGQPL